MLRAAFTRADAENAKKTVKSSVFLRFWEAAHKNIDEIDPRLVLISP